MASNPSAAATLELNYFPQSVDTSTRRPQSHILMAESWKLSRVCGTRSDSRHCPVLSTNMVLKVRTKIRKSSARLAWRT